MKKMDHFLINLKDTRKKFGNVQALNSLTFSVSEYEFVAIVGNNGSGKTTTINILCNLFPYDSGNVEIFGRKLEPEYVSYRDKIGVILSEPILINEFTPVQYLNFVCKFHHIDKKDSDVRAKDLFDLFGINDGKTKQIGKYSSGDKIKISLAASLIHNPELLLFDEPYIHLDIQAIDVVTNLLTSFKGKKTLLITSHNLDLILNLCSRVLLIDKGYLIDDISITPSITMNNIKQIIKERLIHKNELSNQLTWLA